MKRLILIVCLLTFCSGCATMQKMAHPVAQGTLLVDAMQTTYIAKSGGKFLEINKILGATPSVASVGIYFGTSMVATYLVHKHVREPWRSIILWTIVGVETACIINNFGLGIGLAMPFLP
jgi:hypothetical protein